MRPTATIDSGDRFRAFSCLSWLPFLAMLLGVTLCGCSKLPAPDTILKQYPANDLEGVVSLTGVSLDRAISHDGAGSLRITAAKPTTSQLYETGDLGVSGGRITYQAKMRAEGLEGKAYLEMWCQFSGEGEFFARDLQTPLTGTQEWSTEETPFFLKQGEHPTNIKLNVVVEGEGTVWIDDIKLTKSDLQ
jgi:hypothetical protein